MQLWEVLIQDSAIEQKKTAPTQDEEAESGVQNYSGVYKPAEFVGPISDIIKQLPEGLQITRVSPGDLLCLNSSTNYMYRPYVVHYIIALFSRVVGFRVIIGMRAA